MFLLEPDDGVVISPSDLGAAAQCEFGLLRAFDAVLGRGPQPVTPDDALLARTAALGNAHEQRVLRELRRDRAVAGITRPAHSRAAYEAAAADTLTALRASADVVYQGAFFDGRLLGFADFLVRENGEWVVCDTKLARSAKVTALLQIAAYADALTAAGVPTARHARLILGDGHTVDYSLHDILPVYRARRARLESILAVHRSGTGPVAWGDERWTACGRCPECVAELERTSDVLLVAGLRQSHRAALRAAGVHTVAGLASRTEPVAGLSPGRLARLRAQATLQQDQDLSGLVSAEVHSPEALAVLPDRSPGDVFFDFEGDPLWSEPGSSDWGLEYLFGVVEPSVDGAEPVYRPFLAHDRAEERTALVDFLAYLAQRRGRWPDMHVYHYAAYERAALLRLAVRHGIGEAEVDALLRDGVLVDLYAVVRSAVRVSQRSYSLKKLEPLYMGDRLRAGDVTTAGDSIVAYHEFSQSEIEGRHDEAQQRLAEILDYNAYDCRSTLRLRDWLLDRATEHGVVTGAAATDPSAPPDPPEAPHPVETGLRALLPPTGSRPRTADEQAIAMLAATVQYNRREHKPFWWGHFDRLRSAVDDWARTVDVFHVEAGAVERDWAKGGRQRSFRRRLRLLGHFPGGGSVGAQSRLTAIYDAPLPHGPMPLPGHLRVASERVLVVARTSSADGDELVVEETLPTGVPPHTCLPVALAPSAPPRTAALDEALDELGQGVIDTGGRMWPQPGLDLLRRVPPRLCSGPDLPAVGDGPNRWVDVVTAAVLDLDRSYLGVQGPPGTGKTYVAAHVLTRLVLDHGWKVGVVAQAHAAVENVLDACVKAGLPPSLIAKNAAHPDRPRRWTEIGKDDVASWCAERVADRTGYVIGGTAWDLTNTKRVRRGQLDLVVVDEAGQFSLAATVACSVAGTRLLLLGDPQQLPHVSQGTHPEPVHRSALGWLLDGEPVIPDAYGYFLPTTWRMHPALAERVSALSYAGRLRAHEHVTAARLLEGVEPGLHVLTVPHRDNSTESVEEAAEVVRLVRDLLGRRWHDPDAGGDRLLAASDIRVVTPYNAQVTRIATALAGAGLDEVAVGTVDRFQGQEAPVVILSMAASAAGDVSRGVGFLLSRNRLTVSVSRGQWAAYIVRSDVLTDFTPRTPQELIALGAFIGLCGPPSPG